MHDPFDGATIAEVTAGDAELADAATDAATAAFPTWRRRTGPERGKLLARFAQRMLTPAIEARLAELCTRENGKALKESVAEVRYAASFLHWFAGEAERTYGETIPASHVDQRLVVQREPIGPCALVTPWNFPFAMLTRKLGPALAAGCTVVAKPAEQTPLCALALAELAHEIGIPPGVFNVVPTDQPAVVVDRWLASTDIKKIGFTGSTEVGRHLARAAADTLKRVSLELGGNAPFVVLADADLEEALAGAMVAKFRNAGQSCVAANRFVIEAPVADAFEKLVVGAVGKLQVGRGSDPGVDLGPLIDDDGVAKVKRLVQDAIDRGATLVHGTVPDGTTRSIAPIVLTGITSEMAIWREEIFGPVIALRVAKNEDEALAQANDTEFGLVGYVFARDGARQIRFSEGLATGMVGVNEGLLSTAQAPFGGVKHSGFGREGSRHGLDDYMQLKYVATRLG